MGRAIDGGEDGTRKRGEKEEVDARRERPAMEKKDKRSKEKKTPIWEMMFGIDVRSLAAMRVGLAIIIIMDLFVRAWYLHDHYGKWAIIPSSILMSRPYAFSFHFINNSTFFQAILFVINGIFALSFLVGYRTRASTFACWIMMVSLHNRNPYVLNAGDDFLRLFVFWCLFLPLGKCTSIDSIQNSKPSKFESTYCLSLATVATLGQFCIIYWFTALIKNSDEWNVDYTATYYALHLDQFATKWAVILRKYLTLTKLLTIGVIYWEKYGPLLFFVPLRPLHGPIRTFAVFGFWALHIGFGSCLEIGFFMYTPGVCALAFLPAWFWDNFLAFLRRPSAKRLSISVYYNENPLVRKCLLLFRTFFLLHDTSILSTHQNINNTNNTNNNYNQNKNNTSKQNNNNYAQSNAESIFSNNHQVNTTSNQNDLYYTNNTNNNYNQTDFENIHDNIIITENHTIININNTTKTHTYTDHPFYIIDEGSNALFGHAAILKLCSVSPLLFIFVPILKLKLFERSYLFISSRLSEEILEEIDRFTPNKPYEDPPKYKRWIIDSVAFIFFLYIIYWNVAGVYQLQTPASIKWIGPALKIDQWWGMFAPHPPKRDGWLVMPGILNDGTEIDIFTGHPVTYEKPALVSAMYPTQRWRKLLMNLQKDQNKDKRLYYGRYLCREWNFWDRHPEEKKLASFKIIFMIEWTPKPGEFPKEVSQLELWTHKCA